jgi:hypothetical protein
VLEALRAQAGWLLPAVVAVVAIVPVVWALYAQSFAVLGRDQGIFQYVAWALRHGERPYRDIHEINGPFPHAWYALMQLLGGEDEHVFRSIDTWLLVVVYTLGAATIPRWVGLEVAHHRGARASVTWALAGLSVLGAQYARYDWWHTAQRESLYALLTFASLSLQAIAHTTKLPRRALVALGFAGFFTALPWSGKPPCAIFAVMQAAVLVYDRKSLSIPLWRALLAAIAGMTAAGGAMLAFVVAYEDLPRGIVMLSKVPRLHHTIWNETLSGVYHAYNNAPRLDWGLAILVVFAIVFVALRLPRRALLAAVLPIGGFLVFAGQGKAFPYHLHMMTLGTAVAELVVLAAIARFLERAGTDAASLPPRLAPFLAPLTAGAIVATIGLGAISAEDAWLSPGRRGHWASAGATPAKRATRAYVDHFPWGDFSANDLRDAAAYLSFHTLPDERIQTYGFDPYLLFLARRKSASPVIYNFELNVDAALRGGPGARPSTELKRWLMDYREEAESLVLRSVESVPPAAFVMIDRSPFSYPEDAEHDLEEHCPRLHRWMSERYEPTASFGSIRIWLRRDAKARSAVR